MTATGVIASAGQTISGIDVSSLNDGTLNLSVTLTDAGGNTGSAAVDAINKDVVAPAGYSVSWDQAFANSTTLTAMSFTFAGAEVGATYNYSITSSGGAGSVDGTATIATATDQITGIDVTSLPGGLLTLTVTLTDAAGNQGADATDDVYKDATAPSGQTVSWDDAFVNDANQTSVSFTFAGAEVDAGYNYTITSDGGAGSVAASGTISTATDQITGIDVSSLPDGLLTLSVVLTDTAGNAASAVTNEVRMDTGIPAGYTVTFDQAEVNGANESSISFTYASAEADGTYSYTITSDGGAGSVNNTGATTSAGATVSTIDVSALPDGELTLSFTFTDSAGNEGTAATATVVKDATAPAGYTVSWDQTSASTGNETAVSFTFAGAEVTADYSYEITTSGGAGNVTGSGTIATATDQITGIDVSGLADGTLTLSVTLTDTATNEGSAATDNIVKDTQAPAGFGVSIDQAIINAANDNALSFTFSSAETPDATYSYSITSDGGAGTVSSTGSITTATDQLTGIDVTSLPDGLLTLSVTLDDSIGNTSSAETATVYKDTNAPAGYTVSFDQAEVNSGNHTAISFTTASAESDGSYSYSITSDGGAGSVANTGATTAASETISSIDLSGLPDGELTISFTLTDSAGNVGSATLATVVKDATAPSGYTVSWDQSNVNSGNETSVSFTFAGGEATADYAYTITSDGGAGSVSSAGTLVTATDQVTGIDVSSLPDGTLTLSVTLTDTATNAGSATTDNVLKDTTGPSGFSVSVDQSIINAANDNALSFTFTGAETPDATYSYTLTSDGGAGSVSSTGSITTAADQITAIDVSGLPDGLLTLSVTLDDSLGNTSGAETATVYKDTNAPAGFSVSFDQAEVNSGNHTAISFTTASAESDGSYSYTITSDGGAGSVNNSGATTAASETIGSINVSALADGELTLTFSFTDSAGNAGTAVQATVQKDATAPSGYSVLWDQSSANISTEASMSFTFAGAEITSDYNYTITSDGGAGSVTGSGTIATATDQITGIDVSGLPDGTLTLSVTLTDTATNTGSAATDGLAKDTTGPSGFSVAVDQSIIFGGNVTGLSFTFTGAETPNATYGYSITSDGGAGTVASSGALSTSNQSITGINVAGLPDGLLTLSVTITDSVGNTSAAETDNVYKDTTIPVGYNATFDDSEVNAANASSISFTYASVEADGSYNYSISSSGGGVPVGGSGATSGTSATVSGIDVSSLPDGTLTLSFAFTDSAGNTGSTTIDNVTKDVVAPVGYYVVWGNSVIFSGNETSGGFRIFDAEIGTTYNYEITSSGGAGSVTGSGLVTGTIQTVTGLDLSGLPDGTLTLTVTLTDAALNEGADATDTVEKDSTAPSGFTVSIDQAIINNAGAGALSFTFAGAEVPNAKYGYVITSDGGAGTVSNSGTVSSANQTVSGIDVSSLPDGLLTLSVTLDDSLGNTSSAETDNVYKDTVAPTGYAISIDQGTVNAGNETATSFTFGGAEADATYNYNISSSGGAAILSGSGTIVTATDQITSLDVSSLSDGTLTYSVTLTDTAGNIGSAVIDEVFKDVGAPTGFTPQILATFVNSVNENSVSLRILAAEVTSTYDITVSSDAGGTPYNITGTVSNSIELIAGNDLSALNDGTLTMSLTLTDTAGNVSASAETTVTKDTQIPTGYTAVFKPTVINAANVNDFAIEYSGVEIDGSFDFEIEDVSSNVYNDGGSTVNTTDSIVNIDIDGYDEGLLVLSFIFYDSAGNPGAVVTDEIYKDTELPSGYSIAFDPAFVNIGNEGAVDLTLSGAEETAEYSYSITSDGGAGSVDGGPVTITTTTENITALDLSTLPDGTLTVSFTITDTAFNTGTVATATVTKDTQLPTGYSTVWLSDYANAGDFTNQSFDINDVEPFSTGVYFITDEAGNGPLTNGGPFGNVTSGTASGIDLSSLIDGKIFLEVVITDSAGNEGGSVYDTLIKDIVYPTITALDAASANPNNTSSVDYTLHFSEAIQGATLSLADFSLSGTAATGASASGLVSTDDSTFTVTITNITSTGTLTLTFNDFDNVLDSAGNVLAGAADGSFVGEEYDIIFPEPTNQPTVFTSTGVSNNSVFLSWVEPLTGVLPEGYLILAVETGNSFTDPVDGTDTPTSLDLTDGQAEYRLTSPVSSIEFTGLASGVQYDFQIYAFTNQSTTIDYKVDSPPATTATTSTASANLLQDGSSASTSISSIVNSSPGMAVFDFTVIDDGASKSVDDANTKITQLVIRQGTGNEIADWTQAIAGAQLSRYDSATDSKSDTQTADITINADNILIDNIAATTNALGYTADNDTTIYRLEIWLNASLGGTLADDIDSLNFVFDLAVGDILLGNTGGASSGFATGQSTNSGAANNEVNVEAIDLVFETEPAPTTVGIGSTFSTAPVVRAQDANGNLDRSFDGSSYVSVSNGAGVSMTDAPTQASLGRVNFATSFAYNDDGNNDGQLTVTDVSGTGLTAAVSTAITIEYGDNTTLSAGVATIPATISTANSGNFEFAFDFTLTDDDAGVTTDDAVPSIMEQVVIQVGGNNEITDLTEALDSAYLIDDEGNAAHAGVIAGNTITFSAIPSALGTITDDQDKVYSLYIRLRRTLGGTLQDDIDNLQFEFEVDDSDITLATSGSSQIATGAAIASGNGQLVVDVQASNFVFTTEPPATAYVQSNLTQTPVIRSQDDFGNLDTDYTGQLEVVNTDGIIMSNVDDMPVAGIRTFNASFQYNDAGDGTLRITDQAGLLDTTFSTAVTVIYDAASDIVQDAGFTYPQDIDYLLYQTSDITNATGIEVERFTLRDGGAAGTDLDGIHTELTSLTLDVTGWENLERIALYNGATELAEVAAASTASFSGFSLSANDDGEQDFTVKVSFLSTVTDNDLISFAITAATVNSSLSSQMAAADAGGASSTLAAQDNQVIVTATELVWEVDPYNIGLNQLFSPALQLSARDVNGNLDVDFAETLTDVVIDDEDNVALNTSDEPTTADAFVAGYFDFNPNFQFITSGGLGVTITIEAGGLSTTSVPISVSSDELSHITLVSESDDIAYLSAVRDTDPISVTNTALLATFRIYDGRFRDGIADDDGAPTIVDTLEFAMPDISNVDSVGLFAGGVLQQSLAAATVLDFDNIDFTIADNDSLDVEIRISYDSIVTDNLSNAISLTRATNNGGSLFAFADARQDSSVTTVAAMLAGTGKVEVTATAFVYETATPVSIGVEESFDPVPVVEAQDLLGNLDLDYNQSVTISNAGGLAMQNVPTAFASGQMSFGSFQYLVNGDGTLTISENISTGISDITTPSIDVVQLRVSQFFTNADGTTGLQADTLLSGLTSGAILAFSLEFGGGPNISSVDFSQVEVDFGADVLGKIRSMVLVRSADSVFSTATDTGLGVPTTVAASSNSILHSFAVPETISSGEQKIYFVVVNVSTFADIETEAITPMITLDGYTLSSGNATGTVVTDVFNFKDTRVPEITSLYPADNSDNIPVAPDAVFLTFDEPVITLDSTISVFRSADNTLYTTGSFSGYNADSTILYFDLADSLEGTTQYFIRVAAGDLATQAGIWDQSLENPFGGLSSSTSWNFLTTDIVPPVFINGSIAITNVIDVGVDFKMQIDEPGAVHYMIIPDDGTTPPNAAEIFQQTPYTGDVGRGVIPVFYGNVDHFGSSFGLDPNTDYFLYIAAADSASPANFMEDDAVEFVAFTTLASIPTADGVLIQAPALDLCQGDFQQALEPISIIETQNNDFTVGSSQTFNLVLPTGFLFNTTASQDTVQGIGTDIDPTSVTFQYLNNSTLRFTYDINGTSGRDKIQISGLEILVDASLSSTATGNIYRLGGTADQDGNNGDIDRVHGSLAVRVVPEPDFFISGQPGNYTVANNKTQAELVNDFADTVYSTVTYSGDNISNIVTDDFDALFRIFDPTALGEYDITITAVDNRGCEVAKTNTITVFDAEDQIIGLGSSFCSDFGDVIIPRNIAQGLDQSGILTGFRLASLEIELSTGQDPAYLDALVETNAVYTFTTDNTMENEEINFNAVYINNLDPEDSVLRNQIVTINPVPVPSLTFVDFAGGTGCNTGENIEVFVSDTAQISGTSLTFLRDGTSTGFEQGSNAGTFFIFSPAIAEDSTTVINLSYTYEVPGTGCTATEAADLTIHPKPIADIQVTGSCLDDEVLLSGRIDPAQQVAFEEDEASMTWDWAVTGNDYAATFSGQDYSTSYPAQGTYTASLTVTSVNGCISDIENRQFQVFETPNMTVRWNNYCEGDSTEFRPEISNGALSSIIWLWGDGQTDTVTSDVTAGLNHRYAASDQVYQVIAVGQSGNSSCQTSDTSSVFILPQFDIADADGVLYNADFESGAQGWYVATLESEYRGNNQNFLNLPDSVAASSWQLGQPSGTVISQDFSGSGNAWVTNLDGVYINEERSWVYSPCFVLDDLERPMVNMQVRADFNNNDGVAFQYQTVNSFGQSSPWQTLGAFDDGQSSGINWYNKLGIAGAPGSIDGNGTNAGNFGWSDDLGSADPADWVDVRHDLDTIKSNSGTVKVRFRVVLGAAKNNSGVSNEGFAFDNFVVRDRTRNVLVEQFTNTQSDPSFNADEDIWAIYRDTVNVPADIIPLMYHTDFPGDDPFNQVNELDPGGRRVKYGVATVPHTVIDGGFTGAEGFSFNGSSLENGELAWDRESVKIRSLIDPLVSFDLTNLDNNSDPEKVDFDLEVNVLSDETDLTGARVFVAIVEQLVLTNSLSANKQALIDDVPQRTQFLNVLREMLPDAGGKDLGIADARIQTITNSYSWDIKHLINGDEAAIVVWVQNRNKEVLQAQLYSLSTLGITPVSGLSPDQIAELLPELYPNPAHKEVNIRFRTPPGTEHDYMLLDQRGVIMQRGKITPGQQQEIVDTSLLPGGMYFLLMNSEEYIYPTQKIVIEH